ncbi:MAG TPA: DUF5752 family protein [Candidatus Saccharimonadales bacterium]|jgi:hypothetical protein|nr:DUF5752 family protein [Candidatus Saccharimonadales bacterium]
MKSTPLQTARVPFYFNSAAHLLLIGRERANTLGELLAALRICSDDSIFEHTFRTLQEHHFFQQNFSNDFAHWAYNDCSEIGLGEKLAALDVREFTSIESLRQRIVEIVEEYLRRYSQSEHRPARKPFYFCAADTVVLPTAFSARTLQEFTGALRQVPLTSIHYHFIEARLRLKLQSNDFSVWLEESLGLPKLAAFLDRIDIYTSTLEGVRRKLVRAAEGLHLE